MRTKKEPSGTKIGKEKKSETGLTHTDTSCPKKRGRKPKEEEKEVCELCGNHTDVVYKINFEQLSGRAGYWFSFKPTGHICKDCSISLIETLENWYKGRNSTNVLTKFK